jgi:hypothetical protein
MKRIFCLLILSFAFLVSYPQARFVEISHYIFPEFSPGRVLLKTGLEYKYLLNYNSLTEEMVFEDHGKRLAISQTVLDQVDTVFIQDRKFIFQKNKFLELIRHSKFDLFTEHRCRVSQPGKPSGYGGTSQTAAITSYSTFFSDGRAYDLKLPEGYVPKPYFNYWLRKNGEFQVFVNMKQLKDLYPEKKDLFKNYVKQHDVKYNDPWSIVQLIEYLEN